MISSAPTDFSAFLGWLREKTEKAWSELPPGEHDGWQKDTKWAGGLTDEHLRAAEDFFGHPFPDDYRLFLKTLHTTTLQPRRAREGQLLPSPGFYDWINDREALRRAFAAPVEGLLFDVEHNGLWLAEWGARPEAAKDRQALVRREAGNSSPLIPVFGHRYLVATPKEAGNPVLSISGSDIVVYGDDLRSYLQRELAALLNVPVEQPAKSAKQVRLWGWFT